MNILFIGQFYPKGIVEKIAEDTHGKVGFSNHNFEISLINGFSRLENVNLKVITAPMVFSFPHNNKRAFVKKINYTEDNYHIYSIGFCNILGFNMISKPYALTKAIQQEIEAFEGEDVAVIVNTPSLILSTSLFKSLHNIKDKNVKTVLIIPDVPECMAKMSGKTTLKSRLVQQLNKRTAQLSMLYDKYVYLTDAMNDFYNAKPDDYIVMEGLINESKVMSSHIPSKYKDNKEIILYTGSLQHIFGVMNLIKAFVKAAISNAELWICGSGECSSEIEQVAKNNPAIKFYGLVSPHKSLELQTKATILANPRSSNGEYTKYSFPSKTIEYLLVGRSVIMNRLPGVPKEYDKYLYYPDNESVEAWIKKLREIIDLNPEERLKRDQDGRQFILSHKTAKHQCAQIINLCREY